MESKLEYVWLKQALNKKLALEILSDFDIIKGGSFEPLKAADPRSAADQCLQDVETGFTYFMQSKELRNGSLKCSYDAHGDPTTFLTVSGVRRNLISAFQNICRSATVAPAGNAKTWNNPALPAIQSKLRRVSVIMADSPRNIFISINDAQQSRQDEGPR